MVCFLPNPKFATSLTRMAANQPQTGQLTLHPKHGLYKMDYSQRHHA